MFINPVLAQSEITNPALDNLYSGGAGAGLAALIANLWQTAILVGGLALLIYLVVGGIQWLLAGSDKAQVENARNRITNAIVGLAILVVSVAIIMLVQAVLQLDILHPVFTGPNV